ncbi:MAG TPA: tannase/feruloyl esterase family alpha/beta hydrolase [Steroidobacteraceae bacterium]|nr:tannase/feruloyl esterase family alpha/beta hydrolase [Steroidobacteraceae bacterium]
MTASQCRIILPALLSSIVAGSFAPHDAAAASSCADLARLALKNTTITMAQSVAAGAFTPPVPSWAARFMHPAPIPVSFCRVAGRIRPTPDSDIRFEVWLPLSGWTGRYESVGNGGFAGSIRYDSMRNPLLGGSAVASTDDGHQAPAIGPTSADWAFNHPEKIIDHGYRAVHLTALVAKAITAAFYGQPPAHAYFVGCSKGGQEAFMEAQRYPSDFDGIVGGGVANQWTDLFATFMWTENLNLANRESYLSPADITKIGAAVSKACDNIGGVKSGFVNDPLRCRVAPSSLGLTPAKLRTYEAIHEGPMDRAGRPTYAGQAYGSENPGWTETISATDFESAQTEAQMSMYGANFYRNFVYQDKNWSFHGFDLEKGRADAVRAVGSIMNAEDVHFAKFRARGGKLIEYAGMEDSIVTPLSSVRFYQSVVAAQGHMPASVALAQTQKFFRLFLAPGMGHCGGGPGPNDFGQAGGNGDVEHDLVVALEKWVEKRMPPTQVIATKFNSDDKGKGVAMTRPLCLFPKVAKYKGSGPVTEAGNFSCAVE